MEAPQAPEPVTEQPVTQPDESSLSDHEASYSREARIDARESDEQATPAETVTQTVERDKEGKFAKPSRHRAPKDVAGPADVPRIRELTRKLREAEAEVVKLRTPAASPGTAAASPSAEPVAKPSWKAFEEQIGEKYPDWGSAQDAYNDARDEYREQQAKKDSASSQLTTADTAAKDARKAVLEDYHARVTEFAKAHPDFQQKLDAAGDLTLPPVLTEMLITADNGPDLVYHLATHPDVLDEIALLAVNLPVNEQSVALLHRRLTKVTAQAVNTGSVAGTLKSLTPPRPPNPVRTGPMNTGDDPPGDESSLAEHEKAYGRRRR
jgi:hypothetical protein